MDQLIPVVNALQDALASAGMNCDIDLPQIAVVGGQSVGKSSVLEGIVGRAFLPTGNNIVTRRPLNLQLVNTRDALPGDNAREWGEFGHLPGQPFDDFDMIRKEIESDTERVCGSNMGVSSKPIVLKIHSPHVINLTLVDLPGIAKVPVGDQPQDIEQQLRNLVMQYVTKPSCLILAVIAANSDLAGSDALAIGRQVDPEGNRTIGVVTKLDLMDQGCDALAVLDGHVYPLRQGYVGVKCRSYRDVQSRKQLREHAKEEEEFFRCHRAYRAIAHRCGVAYLAKFLNKILMYHIRDAFPELRSRILRLQHEHESELQGYGDRISSQKSEQGALVLHLFSKFASRFADAVEGKLAGEKLPPDQLTGRARIDYIFEDIFAKTVNNFNPYCGLTDNEIRVAIRNATGPRASLFVPETAFELLVKKQITKLEAPSLQCVDLVFEELQRIVLISEVPEFTRFVNLREKIFAVIRGVLKRCLQPTNQMIVNLIHCELAYINTNHPDFIGGSGAVSTVRSGGAPAPSTEVDPRARSKSPMTGRSPRNAPQDKKEETGGFFATLFRRGGTSTPVEDRAEDVELRPSAQSTQRGNWPVGGAVTSGSGMLKLQRMPPDITPAGQPLTDRERIEVDIIKTLIQSYFGIVKKTIIDSVPKAIMYFMVNTVKDVIQRECVTQLYKEELFDVLLKEADDISERRARCRERLEALSRAMESINQVRDHVDVPC